MDKRGWIRIFEAVTAVLILLSVLLVLYNNNIRSQARPTEIYDLQVAILEEIALNDILRNATLASNETSVSPLLTTYVESRVPHSYNYTIKVCDFESTACLSKDVGSGEVYVEERIVGGNLYFYDPKVLRLFVWQQRR